MKGRRVLEFDERAKRLAGLKVRKQHSHEWIVNLFSEEFRAIADFENEDSTLFWQLCQSDGSDPPAEIRAKVDALLAVLAQRRKAA